MTSESITESYKPNFNLEV